MDATAPLGTMYLIDIARMIVGCDTRKINDMAILALEIGYDIRHIAWVVRADPRDLATLLADVGGDESELLSRIERSDRAAQAAAQPQTPQVPPAPAGSARTRRMPASAASRRYAPPAIEHEAVTEILSYLRSPGTDPDVARAMLTNYHVPQLKIIAREAHLGAMSGVRKADIIRKIVWLIIELPRQYASILAA